MSLFLILVQMNISVLVITVFLSFVDTGPSEKDGVAGQKFSKQPPKTYQDPALWA